MKGSSINVVSYMRKYFGLQNETYKEFLAEFLGTFILIIFGNAAVAQSVLTDNHMNDYVAVVWGWALGVTFGVMVSGNVSGGHINPAVTLALAIWGKLSWAKVPVYIVAQYLGSFCASACLFGVYKNALDTFETERSLKTAGIWATYPGVVYDDTGAPISSFLSAGNGFGDQVFATMLLLICVCAITDKKNMNVPSYLVPLMVGFVVLNIGLTFGLNCGFAINPARDLAPRIFTMIAGWGNLPFTASTSDGVAWWWIPVLAPHIGGVLGVAIYSIFIEIHHPITKEEEEEINALKAIGLTQVSTSQDEEIIKIGYQVIKAEIDPAKENFQMSTVAF